jgi:hypothetical protein
MASDTSRNLFVQLVRLAEVASVDYQSFQLAAQRADVEGHALAAGVLRSISEGHAGRAHGLLTLALRLEQNDNSESVTRTFLRSAIRRAADNERMSSALSAQAKITPSALEMDDLTAVLNLTSANRLRLERLLAGLEATEPA